MAGRTGMGWARGGHTAGGFGGWVKLVFCSHIFVGLGLNKKQLLTKMKKNSDPHYKCLILNIIKLQKITTVSPSSTTSNNDSDLMLAFLTIVQPFEVKVDGI